MDKLQASVACALLMVLDPNLVRTARANCPTCKTGYYVTRNCSRSDVSSSGTQCAKCTNCLEKYLDTLTQCSAYTDTVCVPNIRLTSTTGVPPNVWIFTGVFASMLVVVLLALFFKRMISTAKLPPAETGSSEMIPCHLEAKLQVCPA